MGSQGSQFPKLCSSKHRYSLHHNRHTCFYKEACFQLHQVLQVLFNNSKSNSLVQIMDYKEMMKAERAQMLRDSLLNTKIDKKLDNVLLCADDPGGEQALSQMTPTAAPVPAPVRAPVPAPLPISQEFHLQLPLPLASYKLTCPVESMYYVPNCVSEEASRRVLSIINRCVRVCLRRICHVCALCMAFILCPISN